MGTIEIKKTIIEKIEVAPCIKCGSHNIDINDCGYSSFNVAYGTCLECKHEVTFSCSWEIDKKKIVKFWNKKNDPKILKEQYEKEIAVIQEKIKELKI